MFVFEVLVKNIKKKISARKFFKNKNFVEKSMIKIWPIRLSKNIFEIYNYCPETNQIKDIKMLKYWTKSFILDDIQFFLFKTLTFCVAEDNKQCICIKS